MWESRCIECNKLIDRFEKDNDYHAIRLCQCLTNLSIALRERPQDFSLPITHHYKSCPA